MELEYSKEQECQIRRAYRDQNYKKMRGRFCEAVACHILHKKNYKILKKNYHTIAGEVDIIISKGHFVIFVEVKSWNEYDDIALSYIISEKKLDRLRQCALEFIETYDHAVDTHTRMYVRFDVIIVNISCHSMVHYKGV